MRLIKCQFLILAASLPCSGGFSQGTPVPTPVPNDYLETRWLSIGKGVHPPGSATATPTPAGRSQEYLRPVVEVPYAADVVDPTATASSFPFLGEIPPTPTPLTEYMMGLHPSFDGSPEEFPPLFTPTLQLSWENRSNYSHPDFIHYAQEYQPFVVQGSYETGAMAFHSGQGPSWTAWLCGAILTAVLDSSSVFDGAESTAFGREQSVSLSGSTTLSSMRRAGTNFEQSSLFSSEVFASANISNPQDYELPVGGSEDDLGTDFRRFRIFVDTMIGGENVARVDKPRFRVVDGQQVPVLDGRRATQAVQTPVAPTIENMSGTSLVIGVDREVQPVPSPSATAASLGTFGGKYGLAAIGERATIIAFTSGSWVNVGYGRAAVSRLDLQSPAQGSAMDLWTGVDLPNPHVDMGDSRGLALQRMVGVLTAPTGAGVKSTILDVDDWGPSTSMALDDALVAGDSQSIAERSGYSTDVLHVSDVVQLKTMALLGEGASPEPGLGELPDMGRIPYYDRAGRVIFDGAKLLLSVLPSSTPVPALGVEWAEVSTEDATVAATNEHLGTGASPSSAELDVVRDFVDGSGDVYCYTWRQYLEPPQIVSVTRQGNMATLVVRGFPLICVGAGSSCTFPPPIDEDTCGGVLCVSRIEAPGGKNPDLDLAAEDYVGTQYLRVATVLAPSRGEIDCADSTTIMNVGPIKSPDTPGIIVLTYDLERAMGDSAETAKLGYFRVATIEWPGGELVTSTATPTPSGS